MTHRALPYLLSVGVICLSLGCDGDDSAETTYNTPGAGDTLSTGDNDLITGTDTTVTTTDDAMVDDGDEGPGEDTESTTEGTTDAAAGDESDADNTDEETSTPDPVEEPDTTEEPTDETTETAQTTATLSGTVVRTADIQEDGKGDLYVAVFTQNPVDLNAPDDLLPVAQVLIEDIDFNIASSGAPYVLEGIEPQNQPFFAIAFFDDNDNLDPNDPGPDKGDLVSLDGLSGIEIYIDQPGDYSLDLELNAVMPMDL